MTIEPYTERLQAELESFWREVYAEIEFSLDLDGKHGDLRRIPSTYPTTQGGFWLVRDQGRIMGTVALRGLLPEIAELKRLVLRREAQGKRRGLALAQHALAEARRLGFRRVRLDTTLKAQTALRLFRGLGFVEIARYNDNPDAEFWMERDLNLGASL